MSIKIPISKLTENDIEEMEKHLIIEETNKSLQKKKMKYPWIQIPKYNLVHKQDNFLYIPFQWGIKYFGKEYRKSKENCIENKISFKGVLRKSQEEIFSETIQLLNRNKSCVMAVYPGGGKCLGQGTNVLLYNGKTILVEDIKPNMVLVNEKNEQQIVQSICQGEEMLYKIKNKNHPYMDYVVNESHILTLWDSRQFIMIDISLKDYLLLHNRDYLKGIYKDYDGEHFNLVSRRKFYIENSFSQNEFYYFAKDICNFKEHIRQILLCGFEIDSSTNASTIVFRDSFLTMEHFQKRIWITYELEIEPLQNGKYYGFTLTNNGRFLLANGIISHNTITSLAISAQIGLKTFIIVNRLVLIDQWIKSIKNFFGEHIRYQHLNSKNKIQLGCQFYIMNAINVNKRSIQDYENLGIGLLIVDECHLIMTKIFSKSLNQICPRYLLGLSATPFRSDGFDILLELYFGLKKVVRKLYRPHKIYVVETGIKIEPKRDGQNNIIWTSVIDQQVENENRNQKIVDICKKFSQRNILILTKRIKQIDWLNHQLQLSNEKVTCMKDSDVTFDENARILIASFQKVGTGFSHDKLDMLILGCDTEEYFMQYLGRVFRTPDVEPIIIDIIDNHPILKKHFLTRKKVYLESGGVIYDSMNL
jgi:superfamily II DNA or RNA helicase